MKNLRSRYPTRMGQPVAIVDAFVGDAFRGNPAAVCILPGPADEAWMQRVAEEMNLSETACLHAVEGGYRLRWFTPTTEVDLCGHATLASAHLLWETGLLQPDEQARFETRSGRLTVHRTDGLLEMDLPASPFTPCDPPDALLPALGIAAAPVWKTAFDYLVEAASEEVVAALAPDFAALHGLPVRGVIVTARATRPTFDFVSRFFAPAAGIDEDPVTGSAHCALGPYWAARLGRSELRAFQASKRGGSLHVRVDNDRDRVYVGGLAVTTLRGELPIERSSALRP